MSWYLAPSLRALMREIDARYPDRSRASDGTVGDTAHQARKSDHNPDYSAGGVVRAVDVTLTGERAYAVIAQLIRDPRVEYVIHDAKIWSRVRGFAPKAYTALPNKHYKHIHVSIRHTKQAETDTSTWLDAAPAKPAAPSKPKPAPKPVQRPTLRRGTGGTYVREVQRLVGVRVDGVYGPVTEAAVKAWQRKHGLTPDGVVGPQTWAKLLGRPVVMLP